LGSEEGNVTGSVLLGVWCVQRRGEMEHSERCTFKCSGAGACAVLYRHLWPVRLYNVCPHCLINGTIFGKKGKKLLKIKCVLIFSLTLSEIFRILRRIQRAIVINVHRSSGKVPLFLADFHET
jgi:hypothetical protein